MQVTASTVIFPGLELNTGPNRYKEPLRGFASWIFNDFFNFGRFNVTILASQSVGIGCKLTNETFNGKVYLQNIECEGIYGHLHKCESDFSLFALGIENIDHRITTTPIITGPQTESAEMQLLSYNVTAESNISEIGITKIRWAIFAALTLLLLLIVFVNVLALKVNPPVVQRIKRVISWRPIFIRPPPKEKLRLWGRIWQSLNLRKSQQSYFLLLLLFMLSSAVIIGTLQTYSILKSPPKYFSSLKEAVRNKTYKVILVNGLSANLQAFEKDPDFRNLESSERAIWFNREDLVDLSLHLATNSRNRFMAGNKAIIRVTKAFVCQGWIALSVEDRAKFVPPWFLNIFTYSESPSLATYSTCIKPEVRSRLDIMFQRWMESYLWSHYMEGAAFRVTLSNEKKNFLCIENAPPFNPLKRYSKEMDNNEQPLLLLFCIVILSSGIGSSVAFYLHEHIASRIQSHLRRQRRQEIRKQLKFASIVHRCWKVPKKNKKVPAQPIGPLTPCQNLKVQVPKKVQFSHSKPAEKNKEPVVLVRSSLPGAAVK